MSTRLIIRGGRLLCPATGLDLRGNVVVMGSSIALITAESVAALEGDLIIDATDCIVCPGFVDLHAHFCEPGEEHKEDLESGGRAAVRGGFTSVVTGSQTTPSVDSRAVVEHLVRRSAAVSACRVLPMGALTRAREGRRLSEMYDLRDGGAVCLGDGDLSVSDPALLRRAMQYARSVGLPVFEHPEDLSLAAHGVMHEGGVSTRLGLVGSPAVAEEIVVLRDLALCAETGVRLHLGPVSALGAVEAIRRAKADGLPVTCAVTAAHLHFTDDLIAAAYGPNLRSRPPFRSSLHRDALRRAVAEGTIDAITSGHRPQSAVEKDVEFDLAEPGLIGLQTALGQTLQLVDLGHLTLIDALARLVVGPNVVLGRRPGRLAAGEVADLVIFDPNVRQRVEVDAEGSRARNTPLLGQVLPGRVRCTLVNGRRVFETQDLDGASA
ncbi:MAG: dihydroorotase [Myxococcales bacterium]|nr:dihydroorotase [Myxococcales bacterium]